MKRSQGGDRLVTESYKFLTCKLSLILKYETKTVTFLKQPKLQMLQEKFITLCTWLGRSLITQYTFLQLHNTSFQPANCKSLKPLRTFFTQNLVIKTKICYHTYILY